MPGIAVASVAVEVDHSNIGEAVQYELKRKGHQQEPDSVLKVVMGAHYAFSAQELNMRNCRIGTGGQVGTRPPVRDLCRTAAMSRRD